MGLQNITDRREQYGESVAGHGRAHPQATTTPSDDHGGSAGDAQSGSSGGLGLFSTAMRYWEWRSRLGVTRKMPSVWMNTVGADRTSTPGGPATHRDSTSTP